MILIIGDLHLFDGKVSTHINYEKESLEVFEGIVDGCAEIKKNYCKPDEPFYICFSGDLSGALSAKRFQSLTFRAEICKLIYRANEITNNNVYSIIGNHDYSATDMTELMFFVELGLIKLLDVIDIEQDNVRLIGLNYGDLDRQFDVKEGALNVAVIHDNVAFKDINMGFYKGNYQFVEDKKSLSAVDVIYAGHIHNPTNFYTKEIYEGKPINLMYLGCPLRPAYEKDIWETVNIGVVQNGTFTAYTLELSPSSTVFNLTAIDDDELAEEVVINNNVEEDMKTIINSLLNYDNNRFFESISEQIKLYPNYSEEAKKKALKYYEDKLIS